ncbi:response regulator [Rubrivirga sp. IMCC45206]|uniref:hybrid sensor histidine kinase/response regulator transcription factor n=1 Tax=Rubrivirga sp. IMCC45206 TaxID=3391614 RepID=UPI00398FD622
MGPSNPDTTLRPSFRVREWTLDDGLPTPVQAVAQTADGYLWMTTAGGLVRFDGAQFVVFTPDTTPIFHSVEFVGLAVTSSGDLWVGSQDRWAYRLRDGEWTAYSLAEAYGDAHWVQGFVEDGDGTFWAVSTGPYLARFDEAGGGFVRETDRLRTIWPPVAVDDDGVLWAMLEAGEIRDAPPSLVGGAVVVRREGGRFVSPRDGRSGGFSPTQYGPLFHRPAGASVPEAVAAAARGARSRVDLTDAAGRLLTWIWHDDETERVMLVDRQRRAWVQLADGEGANRLAVVRDGQTLATIAPAGATWIQQVFEDRQGSIWAHSSGTGLFQITEEPFERVTLDEGLPRYAARAAPAADGGVIVSTASGDGETRVATVHRGAVTTDTYRIEARPDALHGYVTDGHAEVGHVVEDARARRWGAANHALLRLLDGRAEVVDDGRAEVVDDGAAGVIRVLYPDPADADVLWVGDARGLARRFDARTGTVTDSVAFDVDWRQAVTAFHRAGDGRLWVATDRGLAVVGDDGRARMRPDEVLQGRAVRDLADGPDGALWAATDRGLVRIRAGEARWLRPEAGAPSGPLQAVLLDGSGALWLSGRRALHRLLLADANAVLDGDRERVHTVTLLPSQGHLGASNRLWGAAQAADGSLWIPSYKGVTRIDPGRYARRHARPLPVTIETVTPEGGAPTTLAEPVRLPVGARAIEVSYTAAGFVEPGLIQFRTFLEGYDDGWVDQGPARRVAYGRLTPGRYTLHVQAMNAGGIWSGPVAAPAIVVPSRLWETPWFRGLVALVLLSAVGLAVRRRERTLVERARALDEVVAERTAALESEKRTVARMAGELLTLNEAKSRLFANVSHEFRTPLQLVLGPLADLGEGRHGPLTADALAQVGVAERNGKRLLALVEQLLALARFDAGSVALAPTRIDAAAFAARTAEAFRPLAEREGVSLETDLAPVEGTFDPSKVETALANLLANAISFTPEGGAVRVGLASAPGGGVVFSVSDTGPGLTPDHAARVFDRFYQADGASTRRRAGTGIGLALVLEIANAHGGTADVESRPGEGATFTLSLPAAEAAGPARAPVPSGLTELLAASGTGRHRCPPAPAPSADDTPRVLVVDDNADLRDLVRGHLEDRYAVIEAADGHQALERARAHAPDVVVSDVMMPGLDGLGLLRALRADPETDFVPVLLLTARATVEDTVEGLGLGADDYLAKPFAPAELRARVDALVAGRQRLRDGGPDARPPGPATGDPVTVRPEATAAQQALVARLVQAVDARLGDETLSVDALAQAVGVSRATLYRQLDGAVDGSPADLIWEVRLSRAAALLAVGAGGVGEVAYAVGFKSVAHFSNRFDAHFGLRPSAYAASAPL